MIFEAVGGDGIAKLKSEEPGHGKHLYLFTVERDGAVAARNAQIVGLYEGKGGLQAALRSGRPKSPEEGPEVRRTFLLEAEVSVAEFQLPD